MGVLGTRALPRLPYNPPEGLQLSELLLLRHCPAARTVVSLYLRCWRKDRRELYRFGGSPRTDWAREGHVFRILGLGKEEISDPSLPKS